MFFIICLSKLHVLNSYLTGILTEIKKDNVFVVSKFYIVGRNPTFKRLLWVDFLVDKSPGAEFCIGQSSCIFTRRLGIILLCNIKVLKVKLPKFLHKWLSFAHNYVVQKVGPKENAQSNHEA